MNYSILSDNSIPLQAQMATANTIYEIRGNFDLSNETNGQVTVPNNCLLRFNGGSFSNGVLIADDCKIEGPLVKIFYGVHFQGNFLNGMTFQIEWFVSNYETTFNPNSNKDASGELNFALKDSGIKRVHFNNDRYFPIQNRIIICGNIDITGNMLFLDDSVYYRREPCIYSFTCSPPLIMYLYNSDKGIPDSGYENNEIDPKEEYRQLRKTRLNIDGLNIFCGYQIPNSSGGDESAIVKIVNVGKDDLWGLHINVNITARYSEGSASDLQNPKGPDYTGIEIYADKSNISFIEIWGYIAMCHRGYYVHADSANGKWITDTKIYGNTRCAMGGKFEWGEPVRNFGSHQVLPAFAETDNKAYFYAKQFENYGYVWDLGGQTNSFWNCKYIAKPIGVGFLFDDTQEKYSPVEIVRPTDVFYPNLLADFSKYENQGITVDTKIYRKEENISGKMDIYETLQFKRYQFPDYLMRSDHLSWYSADNSDAGYTVVDSSNIYKYKYVTEITIQGWPLIMAFQDRPPMYISPIFPENDFFVKVKYYNNSDLTQSIKKILFKLPSDAIGSSYYYGRYVKIANIIHENLNSETSRVVIKFVQKFKGNALIGRPIFFIPNYHADKIIRKGNRSLVNLTGADAGQTFYDTTLQKLVVWNGSEWKDALGNTII